MSQPVVSLAIERFRRSLASETDRAKRRQMIDRIARERERIGAMTPALRDEKYCALCGGQLRVLSQSARFCAPRDRVVTTYWGCVECVQIQIEDRVTPAGDHLDKILRLAMAEVGASKGNIQLLDRRSQTLFIAVSAGFERPFLDYFRTVSAGDSCACGVALREQRRIIVEDIDRDKGWKPMLGIARDAGFRAVQSTPLIARDNSVDGMLSTHFDGPHQPSAADFLRMGRHLRRAFELVD